jgi:D-threonine aldolase
MNNSYHINNADQVDSPAILVYPDLIRKNIAKAVGIQGGASMLRPHVKTHKMREVTELQLNAGISRFKCATIAEAEMLADAGAKDILLAYQPTGVKARRLLALASAYPSVLFSFLIDNKFSAETIATVLKDANINAWIDLNVGMNRTGAAPAVAPALYDYWLQLTGKLPAGLHAYDGHIHDTDTVTRFRQAASIYGEVKELAAALSSKHAAPVEMILGGTPCFPFYAAQKDVQTSPGTFVFWDQGYLDMFPDMDFDIAAVLVTRIISIIDAYTICLDLGHKSVAAENPLPRVYFPAHPAAKVAGQSEEHLVVKVPDSSLYRPGDLWYGIPHHICPTVALYDTVHVVENHHAVATWKVIGRDRSITF